MQLTRILETCLYSKNLAETKKFYSDLLGIKLYGEAEGRHVFFQMPDGGMLLFFNPNETGKEGQTLPPHEAGGRQHLAFEVPAADYMKWKGQVSVKSPIVHEQTWDSGSKSFYFRDPDGHLIEIAERGLWHAAST